MVVVLSMVFFLPNLQVFSIFTAEVEGINRALTHIDVSPRDHGQFVIFCDSKSVLECIENQSSKNVIIKEVIDTIHTIILTSH